MTGDPQKPPGASDDVPPELPDLEDVERLLRSVAADRDAALAHAAKAPKSPAEDAIVARFRETMARAPKTPRRTWTRPILVLAAAAALIVALVRFWPREPEPIGPRPELGPKRLAVVEPVGEVASYDRFAWTSEHPPGTRYQLVIRPKGGGETLRLPRRAIEATEWRPSESEKASIPAAGATVMVEAIGPDGQPIDRSEAVEFSLR